MVLYQILIGSMSNNEAPIYVSNTLSQRIYIGLCGRHNVKIVGWEYTSVPATAATTTGVQLYISEFRANSNGNSTTLAFLNTGTDHFDHTIKLDLGVQIFNNFLNILITTQAANLTNVNMVLYLDINPENQFPL